MISMILFLFCFWKSKKSTFVIFFNLPEPDTQDNNCEDDGKPGKYCGDKSMHYLNYTPALSKKQQSWNLIRLWFATVNFSLLLLAHLFDATVEEIVIQRMIEVEVSCVSNKIEKLCNKNCNDCKLRLSA